MATRKQTSKAEEPQAPKDEEQAQEPQATEEEEQGQDEDSPSGETPTEGSQNTETARKDSGKMVPVNSLKRYDYVQPDTGIRIRGYEKEVKVLDDVWVEHQVGAGILEYA